MNKRGSVAHDAEVVVGAAPRMKHESAERACSEGIIGVEGRHAVADPPRERAHSGYLQGHIAPAEKDLLISPLKRVHQPILLLIHQFNLPFEGLHVLPVRMVTQDQLSFGQMGLACLCSQCRVVSAVKPCHFEQREVHEFLLQTDYQKDLAVLLLRIVQGDVVAHFVYYIAELQSLDDPQFIRIVALAVPAHCVLTQLLDIH